MAAAKATSEAADAMEAMPAIIDKSLEAFEVGFRDAIEKALAGEDLTQGELDTYKESLGEATM
jgi:hypothetical protein